MKMESLLHRYNRTEVLYDLDTFLTDFTLQESDVPLNEKKYESIDKAYCLGETPLFSVFEVHHHHVADARVALTKQAVEIMKSRQKFTECALFFFVPKNSDSFRISLVTVDWADNKKASNPRRFSFLVGENQKIHTASQQLSSSVRSMEDLLKRFSIEVVNDEFYKKISEHFENLLKQIDYPNVCEQAKQEEAKRNFAVRLIGRLIFCWFLKKKLRQDGSPLIPESLLSSCIVGEYDNYYHDVLEPLFFETLNKPFEDRIAKCKMGDFQNIPFLNGGLFEAHLPEDGYKYGKTTETCTIQNNWFINFFETLETYNFTIDENTSTDIDLAVDPEMLGRIFENLLASVNPETKESVRKATGSYYTPREIVDYMVTQSLKQYLYTKTDISHGVIDSLFDFEDGTISDADKQKIQKALLTIKVLDPAVGSGAFPMGMLQKMLAVLNRMGLSTQNSINKTLDYQHKLDIIQHCIYGVDIQPMAIEICRLRFFLTLIVDESSDNPQPLPNLNFNFACANSLVALDNNDLLALKQEKEKLDKTIKERESLLSCGGQMLWNLSKEEQSKIRVQKDEIKKLTDKQKALVKKINAINVVSFLNGDNYIEQLRAYRKEFFTASGKEKEELKQKFLEIQEEMFHALKANDWGNDKVLKLQTWKPFDTVSTPWFDPFWMLGVENGFDIVIANPPYIRVQHIPHHLIDLYKKTYVTAWKRVDISTLFIELMTNFLSLNGILCCITSNQFVSAEYGRLMRKYLLEKTLLSKVIDFGDLAIFENAITYVSIFFLTKNQKQTFEYYKVPKLPFESPRFFEKCSIEEFSEEPWSFVFSTEKGLLKKLQQHVPLSKIAFSKGGIITGNDDCFIFEQDNLPVENHLSLDLIRTDNINRYVLGSPNLKIFYPCVLDNNGKTSVLDLRQIAKKYPRAYKHIMDNADALRARKDSRTTMGEKKNWYSPVRFGTLELFNGEKILTPWIVKHNKFVLDNVGYAFSFGNMYAIISRGEINIKVLLGILNSKLVEFYLHCVAPVKQGGYYSYGATVLDKIPLAYPEKETENKLLALVDYILSLKRLDPQTDTSSLEKDIDCIVYKLYGLTEEEIKIVEESQPKKLKN